MGIEKLEIPSELTIFKKHSETFRNDARHLQIIFIKNLRGKNQNKIQRRYASVGGSRPYITRIYSLCKDDFEN